MLTDREIQDGRHALRIAIQCRAVSVPKSKPKPKLVPIDRSMDKAKRWRLRNPDYFKKRWVKQKQAKRDAKALLWAGDGI